MLAGAIYQVLAVMGDCYWDFVSGLGQVGECNSHVSNVVVYQSTFVIVNFIVEYFFCSYEFMTSFLTAHCNCSL